MSGYPGLIPIKKAVLTACPVLLGSTWIAVPNTIFRRSVRKTQIEVIEQWLWKSGAVIRAPNGKPMASAVSLKQALERDKPRAEEAAAKIARAARRVPLDG